jgi:hypothetical protein
MAYFRVMLHGHGIKLHIEGESRPAVGFYCTRQINASTAEAAVLKAKEMVLQEWSSPQYAAINKGALPILDVDSVEQVTFFSSLTFKNSGHTFYPEETT